jgi:hypothetical protein
MSIVLQSTGGGSVTIAEPATASNLTATLPAATGTVMVSGNMPAFSAYQAGAQNISNNTLTKITLDTEVFDTNNNFASGRYTPTVAGYYQISASVTYAAASANGTCQTKISKNGFGDTNNCLTAAISGQLFGASVSALLYLNGSTDYVELYTSQSTGSTVGVFANSAFVFMTGSLVRTA